MSGLKFVLDTNVIIGVLKGAPEAAEILADLDVKLEHSAVSQITRIELLSYPRLTAQEETNIGAFLNACETLLLSPQIELDTITIRRESGIKLPDAIVAATARVNGLRLVTLDKALQNALIRLPQP